MIKLSGTPDIMLKLTATATNVAILQKVLGDKVTFGATTNATFSMVLRESEGSKHVDIGVFYV